MLTYYSSEPIAISLFPNIPYRTPLIGRAAFRSSSTTMRSSSFLLALASPVFHTMLCSKFRESKEKKLRFDDVERRTFIKTLDLWCGRGGDQEMELCEVQQLAIMADRFQITEVTYLLEEAVMGQLCLDACGKVLMWSRGCRMLRLEAAALKLVACRFEEFARTAGFMLLEEEEMSILLDDDRLVARSEEAVWEAVIGWKCGTAGKVGWRGVVGKIRFPLRSCWGGRRWWIG
jgi:hypothetical protein